MLNLPNLLTALRLALTPFVIWAILSGRNSWALALFIIAAITDVLDGAAARRLGLKTQTGAYFDPIADKFLMSGVFLALAGAHVVPLWFVAIVFGRDIYLLLAVGLFFMFTPIRKFPPSAWGKASTFVQILTAAIWVIPNAFRFSEFNSIAMGMTWISGGVTLWSGIHYTVQGIRRYRSVKADAADC